MDGSTNLPRKSCGRAARRNVPEPPAPDRKVKLVGDDGLKRENYGKKIHEAYNGFENTDPQKYVKQIKGFLSMYK